MAEAFHCRLKGPVVVDKKTLVELQGFQAVSGHGSWGLWGQRAGSAPTTQRVHSPYRQRGPSGAVTTGQGYVPCTQTSTLQAGGDRGGQAGPLLPPGA